MHLEIYKISSVERHWFGINVELEGTPVSNHLVVYVLPKQVLSNHFIRR